MPPTLLSLPDELLEEVAILALLADSDLVGPPSQLVSILLICHETNLRLSWLSNNALYHRIFNLQFDSSAVRRRLGTRGVLTASVLSRQLRHTWPALCRLRAGDLDSPSLLDDFWDAFLLVVENDGKNFRQLEWSRVFSAAESFVMDRIWQNTDQGGWPRDSPIAALALWLYYSGLSSDVIASYDSNRRQTVIDRVLPFVVVAFKYPSFHAPDVVFDLPLTEEVSESSVVSQTNVHGTFPVFRRPRDAPYTRVRYDTPFHLVEPSLPNGARLIYVALREAVPIVVPLDLPVDRATAISAGITAGQTQADLHELNNNHSTRFVPRGTWGWVQEGAHRTGLANRTPSEFWDDDFRRITSCLSPWAELRYKAAPYTPGSLDGLWHGRYLVPDLEGYLNLVQAGIYPEHFSETAPWMSTWPVYMRLREHHSISPAQPVPVPRNAEDRIDNAVYNAWLPPVGHVSHDRDTLTITADGVSSVHETYVEGRANSHDEDKCAFCLRRSKGRHAYPMSVPDGASISTSSGRDRVRGVQHPSAEEDAEVEKLFESVAAGIPAGSPDDEWISFGEDGKCSGIQDIVITGETDPNHGMAWGHYRMLGRVRKWDGLIAIVRTPSAPGRPRWVFRGNLHFGKTIVGTWRGMINIAGQARAIPWEGAFAMSRRDE